MRLLVCGSREWPGAWEDIAVHLPESGDVTILHGACSRIDWRGVQTSVDMLADFAARGLGFSVETFPADWSLGRKAGPLRNARMLAEGKPERGLAFGALMKPAGPTKMAGLKSTGTGDMVGRLLAAGIPVRWVSAPGAVACDITAMPAPEFT